jgi:Tfp pilus assembly protein PilV
MRCQKCSTGSHRTLARGSTIVEVVVALFLIKLLVLAVYGAISTGITTVRMARENLRATQILVEKMEAIRLYNWEQLDSTFIAPTFVSNYDVKAADTNAGVLFHGTVSIEPADVGTSYSDSMKQVTVRLDWKTGKISRSRELITLVARSGIQNYIY